MITNSKIVSGPRPPFHFLPQKQDPSILSHRKQTVASQFVKMMTKIAAAKSSFILCFYLRRRR